MLETVIKNTQTYINQMTKADRKVRGQFFTSKETAVFMASMFDFDNLSGCVSVLDPGAGSGILSAALLDRIESIDEIDSVCLTCYETDENVIPVLESNLEYISNDFTKEFRYEIRKQDYILTQAQDFNENKRGKQYDLVIGNPPYLKVLKDHPAAVSMPKVVYGAPNLYFIFASMSLHNLKDECEMVYIIPRSWTSGAYFKKFREYFLTSGSIEHMHLFVSRDKVFQQENVLQETMILKVKKTCKQTRYITITSSKSNCDFDDLTLITVPDNIIIQGNDRYVFLPINNNEVDVLNQLALFSDTLPTIGIKMKTGIVVDFREYDHLSKTKIDGETIPLFYAQHISNGVVNHNPSGKEHDWLFTDKTGLIQKNKNYLFCKRFTAKEERRRLQCGIYKASDFPEYAYIGTQNKINYVDAVDSTCLPLETVFGLYVLFNSTLYDKYYRILNGSTQVNSTEVNTIPVPKIEEVNKLGRLLMQENDLSTTTCDCILAEVAND